MIIEKVEKPVANLLDRTENVIHLWNLKQTLDHGLVLKKVFKVIKFNQNAWLKPYVDINNDLRKKAKYDFEKSFLELINPVFEKIMENVRTNRDIKLEDNRKKKKLLGIRAKLSYYKVFQRKFINKRIEKAEILRKKPVCLGLSILELSKILMYEFCYDYAKPKYGENPKISCVQADSFKAHVKTDDTYNDIEDVETRFDNSNYKLDRPLSKGKNKKVIELMKDELGKKICWIKTKNL